MEEKLEKKRIILFLVITFAITYLVEFGIILRFLQSGDAAQASMAQALIAGVMFIPAIGVLITRLVTKEGFQNAFLFFNFKGNVKYYLIGWFGPSLLTLAGAAIYFLIFSDKLDLNMTMLLDVYKQQNVEMTREQLQSTLLMQLAMGIFIGPLLNFVNCFGEEWGWRGYLLPKMQGRLPILPMLLVNGIIWGLWHAPLTMMGHNYGVGYMGYPITGILAMCVFCIVMGTIFSYVTIKTKSCLPAVFAHGGLNSIASFGMYITTDGGNPFVGPVPTGIIGGIGFIIVAIVMAVLLFKEEKKKVQE